MTLTLVEAIEFAESALERGLTGDEVALIGRMVDAGKGGADILTVLDKPIAIPEDDAGKTYLYEASGDGVREIPVAKEEQDGGDADGSGHEAGPGTADERG